MKAVGAVFLGMIVILNYQNCAKGFRASSRSEIDQIMASSQCKAPLTLSKLNQLIAQGEINCDSAEFYSCDISVFSPDVQNGKTENQSCDAVPGISGCVPVLTHYFYSGDPKLASPQDQVLYQPGGSYNRQEIRCTLYSSSLADGQSLDAESIQSGLTILKNECKVRGRK